MDHHFIFRFSAGLLAERLDFVKVRPQKIAVIGADFGVSAAMLHAKYKLPVHEFDVDNKYYRPLKKSRRQFLLPACRFNTFTPLTAQLPASPGSYDFLISNLFLVRAPERKDDFLRYSAQLLKKQGLLFFVFLGLDSLSELWQVLQCAVPNPAAPLFWDMHDIGDDLLRHGFKEPVLSMEKLVLTYRQVPTLLNDLAILGLLPLLLAWLNIDADEFSSRLARAGGLRELSLELIFAHAVKADMSLPGAERQLHFYKPA